MNKAIRFVEEIWKFNLTGKNLDSGLKNQQKLAARSLSSLLSLRVWLGFSGHDKDFRLDLCIIDLTWNMCSKTKKLNHCHMLNLF